ncbi:MAG: energy transducer TonB [Candidatus Sulfotelmatobacter sp.]
MRMRCSLFLLFVFACSLWPAGTAQGQQSSGEAARPILQRMEPQYPEIAMRMNISGTVKVIATVAPDGKVKSVKAAGGHPLLIQAAQQAISQWRFAPASAESRELIELHFNPHTH